MSLKWENTLAMTTDGWFNEAPCRNKSLGADWFADRDTNEHLLAKHICRTLCESRKECLALAFATDERHGIWGGFTPMERSAIKNAGGVGVVHLPPPTFSNHQAASSGTTRS